MINCIIPSNIKRTLGYTEPFVKAVRRAVGEFSTPEHTRNVARNLGVQDDISVNLTKANGKKVFGKNLTDVSEWEKAVAEKGVPNNVLVNIPYPDGITRTFMSSKNTKSLPSKWINDSGRIAPNPDWDMIGKNQTLDVTGAPSGYVRESDRVFRPANQGEEATHYLNVQNPITNTRHIDNRYIIDNNIDAYDLGGGRYELVHHSQAIPIQHVNKKANRGSIQQEQVKSALSEPQVREKLLDWGNMAPRVATVAGGAIAGKLTDPDNEWGGAWYGGVLGFALGTPSIRTKVKGVFGKTDGKGKDAYDEFAHNAYQNEKKVARAEDLRRKGWEGDPESPRASEFEEQVAQPYREAKNNGDRKGMFSTVFRNKFFESGRNLLTRLGSKTAEELKAVFESIENMPNVLFRRFGDRFNEAFETQDGIIEFRNVQRNFVRDFHAKKGITDITDEQAEDTFGAAIHRIITHGTELRGGRFVYDESIAGKADYSGADNVLAEFDRALLEDDQARLAVEYIREAYDDIGRSLVDTLSSGIEREISNHIDGNYKELARRIVNYKGSVADFIDENPVILVEGKRRKMSAVVRSAKGQDNNFKRVLEMSDKRHKLRSLEGRYVPQMQSSVKTHQRKQAWIQKNSEKPLFVRDPNFQTGFRMVDEGEQGTHTVQQVSPQTQEYFWNRRVSSEILNRHRDKWKLFDLDDSKGDVRVKKFKDFDEARKALIKEVDSHTDEAIRDVIKADIADGRHLDDYIQQIRRDGDVTYELQTPQRYQEQGINIFENNNVDRLTSSMIDFKTERIIRKSNHFDRPRNYILPTSMLETNAEKVMRAYTQDVGRRMASIKNDIYDTEMFRRKTNAIRREIGNKLNSADTETAINDIKSWYKVMQGLDKDLKANSQGFGLEAESQRELVRDTVFNAMGKFATSTYMYATSFYAPLQTAVIAPFFIGWKNTYRAYKLAVTNPQELRRMTQELRKMNIIHESVGMVSPEHQAVYRRSQFGEYLPDWADRFANVADRFQEFAVNFSVSRPILDALGKNMDDMGALRLFGGSLLEVSGGEASIFAVGALRHVQDLTEALSKMRQTGEQSTMIGRTRYNADRIIRDLEDYGIDNVERFVGKKKEFDKYIDSLKGDSPVDIDPEIYDQMTNVMSNSVDMYHGRSKLVRPLGWLDNPFGRMFAQFSTYTQNFGVRVTRERIYRPFQDWESRYGQFVTEGNENIPVFKLALGASTRNDRLFKEVFGDNWEQAYDDFPVEAVNNFFKVFGALGVGKVMLISRAGFLDLTEMLSNEAIGNDDYESWKGFKRQLNIGNDPVSGDNITISDFWDDGLSGYNIFLLTRAAVEDAIKLGFGGPITGKLLEELRYNNGVGQSFPVASTVQNIFDKMSKVYQTPLYDKPYEIAKQTTDFTLQMTPPLGTFNGLRQSWMNAVFNKPKNRGNTMLDPFGEEVEVDIFDN